MKFPKFLILLAVYGLILAACSSDSARNMFIPYRSEAGTQAIYINDHLSDGVYVNEKNGQLYCEMGPDRVISLPAETLWKVVGYNIEFKASAVCLMGQKKFDEFLGLFELVPTTP